MKFLIASDIHGSAYFAKELMKRFEAEACDRMLLLGDILYHGPRNDLPKDYAPKAVIEMLNSVSDRILSVRGNCDSEVDEMVLDFPVLADYALVSVGDRTLFLTHGHKNVEKARTNGNIILSGHTHIPECLEENGVVMINPGSVSIPKENSPYSYMTFDGSEFLWKNIETGEVYKEYKL